MANIVFDPAREPATPLGRYRVMGPACGLKVSPLCLGAMNFGDAWKSFMGECDKKTSFDILDTFYNAGGNFIDTANSYQEGESETWIGEWLTARGNRDELVIATKYTTNYAGRNRKAPAAYAGNSYKNMVVSLNASLKKLQTDYVDVLYVHWWDTTTPVEEVMQGLNTLVKQGKVLYLGISDTPAWIVAKANQYARDHGMAQFVVYQGRWNAADRDIEREVIPMAREFGMGVAPWASIGQGKFKTEEQRKADDGAGRKMGQATPNDIKISAALDKIAQRKGTVLTSIALAYVVHAYPYTYPIVGGRSTKHLQSNIEALNIKLSDEDLQEIEGALGDFKHQFPASMQYWFDAPSTRLTASNVTLLKAAMHVDTVPHQGPAYPPTAK